MADDPRADFSAPPAVIREIEQAQASTVRVRLREDLAAITPDAQKIMFATAILGGASVDEASKTAQIRPDTGRLWLKKDSEVREVIIYAMEMNGVDPVNVVEHHKKIRDRAFEKDLLDVSRKANLDLAKMMGMQGDFRSKKFGADGSGAMDRIMRLMELVEAREVPASVVGEPRKEVGSATT